MLKERQNNFYLSILSFDILLPFFHTLIFSCLCFKMPNLTMSSGLPCNNYNGYCDTKGKCQTIDLESPMNRLYQNFTTTSKLFSKLLF